MHRLARTGVSLFFAATAVVGLSGAADEAARGRELAERLCATCHLNPGQGEKTGPAGIPGFQAVARRPNQTREAIVRWLQSVPSVMPNHHLTQDEMEDLAQFILSLRTEP
jgi:mono/diheme cytochrome c family protein